MYKNKVFGKIKILDEPYSINNRKYCKAKCSWCGKEFTTQLRTIKKGKGCGCKKNTLELLNKKFGDLEIIAIEGRKAKCKCICCSIKYYDKYNLISGNSKNCGCKKRNNMIKRNIKHNMSNTRIYRIYQSMKKRCYNPKSHSYKWYGNKNIKLCEEWNCKNGFVNFYNWAIKNGYDDKLSIERIDINKDYSPNNCKWIELKEQLLNTSKTIKIIDKNNKIFTINDLSIKYNIPKSTLYNRAKKINKKIIMENEIIWES